MAGKKDKRRKGENAVNFRKGYDNVDWSKKREKPKEVKKKNV